MNKDLNQRESLVRNFINAQNSEINKTAEINNLDNNETLKYRKLNAETTRAKCVCIDNILGKIYKNALPFNDPKKSASDDEVRNDMHNFIANRTDGKNSEYYIREAIKRTNSSTLKAILTEAENFAKKYYSETVANIAQIRVSDINFNPNDNTSELDKINKKLDLDEIAEIIQNNVQKAIHDESEKAKKEEEYNKNMEDMLAQDTDVQDDSTMESALGKMNIGINHPKIYQPSLFESIMLGKSTEMTESSINDIFNESVHEYTKLNVIKALKLESFNLKSIKNMADIYLG